MPFALWGIMKNSVVAIVMASLLIGCTDGETKQQRAAEKEERNVSQRDYGITKAIAYSTLFLDSLTLEEYITTNKITDSIARRLRSFYNARNYQFAWFSSDGLTEQARGFWNLHEYVTTYDVDTSLKNKGLQKTMDRLVSEDELSVSPNKTFTNTELTLTRHFIQYILNNYEKGYVKRKEMEKFIPSKKQDALTLADSLINKKHKDDKYFEDVNASYRELKKQLVNYYNIVKSGGWPQVIPLKAKLKKGSSNPGIIALKKRLTLTGDIAAGDTSAILNDSLELGIKHFQIRHGLTPTGKLDAVTLKELNVPAIERLQQILMNMDRMRWVAAEPQGHLIVVNIPEFILHMYEGPNKVFDMEVVVGKEGHSTMMFNGELNQVVFSPYWNVPPSIVENEILPELEKNKTYLESQNMEVVSENGDLPVIRQKPGPKNALGKVKFLFPNSFNIYFHDTPSKSLFEKDKRAFSHGCIRLREPEKMANYVLRNQPEWTPEKIREAMNSGEEKFVKVKEPIPVIITYYTAWVDEGGNLNFRDDIYGHDNRLREKMFLQ